MVGERRRLLGILVLGALTVLAAACSSGAGATQPPVPAGSSASGAGASSAVGGAIDAAGILTPDVAASIIGGSLTKLALPPVAGMSILSYTNTTGDSVTVVVEPGPVGTGSATMQRAIQAAGANGELQPVGDLGDTAGKVVNANDATVVFVKGTTLVVVSARATASSGSDLETKLEPVARLIADKL
jgi:hypothetical protein